MCDPVPAIGCAVSQHARAQAEQQRLAAAQEAAAAAAQAARDAAGAASADRARCGGSPRRLAPHPRARLSRSHDGAHGGHRCACVCAETSAAPHLPLNALRASPPTQRAYCIEDRVRGPWQRAPAAGAPLRLFLMPARMQGGRGGHGGARARGARARRARGGPRGPEGGCGGRGGRGHARRCRAGGRRGA